MGILDEVIDDSNDTPDEKGIGKLVKRAIEVGVREGVKVGPGSWGAMKVCPFCLAARERVEKSCWGEKKGWS